jgi:hypothetical protein
MYIKPVLSDHLSYVIIFHCSVERPHKTGLTVHICQHVNGVILVDTKVLLFQAFVTIAGYGHLV